MGAVHKRAVGGAAVAALTVGLAVGVVPTASAAVDPASALVINEVYGGGGNAGAPYSNDFVELYNKGTSTIDLGTYSVQYASAAGTSWSGVVPLSGSIAPGSYYLVQGASGGAVGAALPTPNATSSINLSATNGNVALASQTAKLTCSTTACAGDAAVVDLVGFGSGAASAGTPAPAGSNTTSVNRTGFANTGANSADFTTAAPTPAAGTVVVTPPTDAGTKTIAEIQGTTDTSPLAGSIVTTTGVVTAAYPTGGLNGFTLQTAGTGGPRDTTAPSDGVFVFQGANSPVTVSIGDSVSVRGTVSEYFGLTEISATAADVTELTTPLAAVTPATASWPTTDAGRESLESVLYAPGTFTVTDSFSGLFGSAGTGYGEVGLASGSTPLIQPTDVADAQDAAAIATVVADNAARKVTLDDGSSAQYGPSSTTTSPYLSLADPVRVGSTVEFPQAVVVSYGNGTFKLEPTSQVTSATPEAQRPSFSTTREAAPKDVGGDLSISSFNVLNYFTTLGSQVSGCTSFNDRAGNPVAVNSCPGNGPRGAWGAADLKRQQDKIVTAINANDASVTGLMEIENSAVLGDPKDEAVTTLVAALNAAAGSAKWAFVPSSTELPPTSQMDVINNAIIYQPAEVTPLGAARALGTLSGSGQAFDNAREPIAQAFTPVGGGTPFLAVVNHFKSKGSGTDDGTGQGNANPDRVNQATALAAWVPTVLPDGVSDTFLLGDFNSYTQEDPLQVLHDDGYENLAQEGDYSYSFSGLSGSLDHVLANASAQARVTGSDVWNINSPESVALEYSHVNYTPTNLYAADPFRASDHDPVKVGFTSGDVPPAAPFDLNLLNINDFHGRIDANTVKFAGTIEQLRAAAGEANTLFLSAGDNVGASLYASSSSLDANGNPTPDQPTIDVLNALGLQASALGNHEFDRSQADLDNRIIGSGPNADWAYLGANIYTKGTTTPAYKGYQVITVNGVRVGIIGAITQETGTLVSPAGIANLEFGDPVDAVNRVAGDLTDGDESNGEADVLVAEYHEGASEGTVDGATLDKEVAAGGAFAKIVQQTSPAVSAIFTGHTHKEYVFNAPVPGTTTGKTRPILQTGSYGERIGQIVLTVDPATGTVTTKQARNVNRVAAVAPQTSAQLDAALIAQYPRVKTVNDITQAAITAAAKTGGVPVGSISADITRAYSGGGYTGPGSTYTGGAAVRDEESSVGMLVANAQRDATIPSGDKPVLAITNPGGLRADLLYAGSTGTDAAVNKDGVITVAEAVAVQPFANSLFLTTLTGTQLKTVLEQQDQPSNAYLALGLSDNVTYTYDRSQPVGSRITSITVNGKTVSATDSFRVATNSFLATGGDNFSEFKNGTNTVDTGLIDLDVFVGNIKATSPVTPITAKRGVSVTGLSDAEKTPTAGSTIAFDVSDLGLTSVGSPQVTSVTATIAGTSLGSFPVNPSTGTPGAGIVQTGTASVSVTVPSTLTGPQTLTLTATPGGTTVTIPLTVVRSGSFYLAPLAGGPARPGAVTLGTPGDTAISGDFDGDGTSTVGTYRDGIFTLRDEEGATTTFGYGDAGDLPVIGDWDGNGTDTVGVFRAGQVYLRNANSDGNADLAFNFGAPGDLPVAGDFNGDGTDTVGVHRGPFFYLTNTPGRAGTSVPTEVTAVFGIGTDVAVVGDFNGDGVDSIGVQRGNEWYLSNSTTTGRVNLQFAYGDTGDQPVVGSWSGYPFDGVGVARF